MTVISYAPSSIKKAIEAAVADLATDAPGALDTLNELAAALGDDANFAATVTSALGAKAASADVILKSIVDAAGDLIVGTGVDTVGRLAKGAPLEGLRVNAAGTALEYAAPAAGKVSFPMSAGGPVSAPTFVGASSVNMPYGTTATLTKPGGVAAGDMIILTGLVFNGDSVNTPSGFTLLAGGGTTGNRVYVFYKVAGASEPAEYVVTFSGSTQGTNTCEVWRGALAPVLGGALAGNGNPPAYVASAANVMVVGVFLTGGPAASFVADTGAGWTQRHLHYDASGPCALIVSKETTGAGSYQPSKTAGTAQASVSFALLGGGGAYTLLAGDAGTVVEVGSAAGATVTIPQNLFTIGDVVRIRQTGAGRITAAAGAGVTVTGARVTNNLGDELWLQMRAANDWSSLLIPVNPAAPLGAKSYNPATTVVGSLSPATVSDLDATNLAVSFVAPASGKIIAVLSAACFGNTNYWLQWLLRDGSTEMGERHGVTACAQNMRQTARIPVSGLTPGATYTFKWAARVQSGTGNTLYGQSGGEGPATMEIWASV